MTTQKTHPHLASANEAKLIAEIAVGARVMIVVPVKEQLASVDEVRKRSGIGYGWMCCDDYGKPDEFRVVGPVGVVRDLDGAVHIRCPWKIGDIVAVKETWCPLRASDYEAATREVRGGSVTTGLIQRSGT